MPGRTQHALQETPLRLSSMMLRVLRTAAVTAWRDMPSMCANPSVLSQLA